MGSSMRHPQALLHDAASLAQRNTLLGLLGASPLDLDAVTDSFLDDPVLLHALLRALPLEGARIGTGLRTAVAQRIGQLGPDMLTAWLLSRPAPLRTSRTDLALRTQSLHAAKLARAIAHVAGLPFIDDAALAALWSRLAPLLQAVPTQRGAQPAPTRSLNAQLALECGCPELVVDALVLADSAEEQIVQAHTLVGVVWSANRLAANAANWLDACARVTGLDTEQLANILSSVGQPAQLPAEAESDGPASSLPTPLATTPSRLVEAALAGFALKAFAGLDDARLRARYEACTRLLCDQQPLLVVVAHGDQLEVLPLTGQLHVAALYHETPHPLHDEASVLALCIRSQMPTSCHHDDGPGRSVRDWQLSRWLGQRGFVCLPFMSGAVAGAVLVAPERSPLPTTDVTRTLVALTSSAAAVALEQHQRRDIEEALRHSIELRHREHTRRIAHEARNPLSVIRSYLHLIPQRHRDVTGLADDLRMVQDEIDRLGGLIDAVAQPPVEVEEPRFCDVSVLLHDMRAMLGETLFASRGIHFELRTTPELPPVAMPASALRQVVLNLLHNAADILHPGGRCTVALAGELIADGVRCLEIRVIDNGPGLPPERLGDLFSPRPSAKGGQHQGIGLTITRELLEQWRARILCRSQPSVGTSFQLLVPVEVSE